MEYKCANCKHFIADSKDPRDTCDTENDYCCVIYDYKFYEPKTE